MKNEMMQLLNNAITTESVICIGLVTISSHNGTMINVVPEDVDDNGDHVVIHCREGILVTVDTRQIAYNEVFDGYECGSNDSGSILTIYF